MEMLNRFPHDLCQHIFTCFNILKQSMYTSCFLIWGTLPTFNLLYLWLVFLKSHLLMPLHRVIWKLHWPCIGSGTAAIMLYWNTFSGNWKSVTITFAVLLVWEQGPAHGIFAYRERGRDSPFQNLIVLSDLHPLLTCSFYEKIICGLFERKVSRWFPSVKRHIWIVYKKSNNTHVSFHTYVLKCVFSFLYVFLYYYIR